MRKFNLGGFKVNPVIHPKGLDIQRLTDNQVKFAFGGFSHLRKFTLGGFKVNSLMYLKRLDIQKLTDD